MNFVKYLIPVVTAPPSAIVSWEHVIMKNPSDVSGSFVSLGFVGNDVLSVPHGC